MHIKKQLPKLLFFLTFCALARADEVTWDDSLEFLIEPADKRTSRMIRDDFYLEYSDRLCTDLSSREEIEKIYHQKAKDIAPYIHKRARYIRFERFLRQRRRCIIIVERAYYDYDKLKLQVEQWEKEKDPVLDVHHEKRATLFQKIESFFNEAAKDTNAVIPLHEYLLSSPLQKMLKKRGTNELFFNYCPGLEMHHQLHQEIVNIAESVAKIYWAHASNKKVRQLVDGTMVLVETANACLHEGMLCEACSLVDAAWYMREFVQDYLKVKSMWSLNYMIASRYEAALESLFRDTDKIAEMTSSMLCDALLRNEGLTEAYYSEPEKVRRIHMFTRGSASFYMQQREVAQKVLNKKLVLDDDSSWQLHRDAAYLMGRACMIRGISEFLEQGCRNRNNIQLQDFESLSRLADEQSEQDLLLDNPIKFITNTSLAFFDDQVFKERDSKGNPPSQAG